MSDETNGSAKAAPAQQDVYRSAAALTLGLSLLSGGAVVLLLTGWLGPAVGESVYVLLMILGVIAVAVGLVQLVIGVYQCADNIDRTAKALLDAQRS